MFCAENSGFCARVPLCLCGNAARRAMRTRAAPKAEKRRRVRHHRRAGGKKAGPARGARAQTARAPFCFGLPHRHHHAFCRLTAAGAAVAPQKGRRARPVRALPPAPGPGPQPEKRAQQKPPAPGDGGWGFFFRQAGARLLCFPLRAVLHKKAKPTLPSAPNQNLPLWQVGALPWVSCSLLPQRREVCNPSTDTGLPMIG